MKIKYRASAARAGAMLMAAGLAYATQPPDVVNSDSNNDTAMGTNALLNLSTGSGNTGSGAGALQTNTTGIFNTASGAFALYHNATGNSNTADGYAALDNNSDGADNVAVGQVRCRRIRTALTISRSAFRP